MLTYILIGILVYFIIGLLLFQLSLPHITDKEIREFCHINKINFKRFRRQLMFRHAFLWLPLMIESIGNGTYFWGRLL